MIQEAENTQLGEIAKNVGQLLEHILPKDRYRFFIGVTTWTPTCPGEEEVSCVCNIDKTNTLILLKNILEGIENE